MSASEASVTQYRKRCNLRWSLPKLALAARICSARVSMFFCERQPSGDKAYIYIPPPSQARKREMARSKTVQGSRSRTPCARRKDWEEPWGRKLDVAAALHGFEHCHLIGEFQVRAHRDADTDARNADAQRLQQLREVHGGGFAFGRGVGGDDDLLHRAIFQPLDQALDLQLLGPYPLQRRQRAAQHVIQPAVVPGLLYSQDVVGLFHHADGLAVARGVGAIQTRIGVADVVAH